MAVNGVTYDYEDLEIKLGRETVEGISSIQYKPKTEPGKVYGTKRRRRYSTIGTLDNECSFEMPRPDGVAFLKRLGAKYMTKEFDIVVNFAAEGQPIQTDSVSRCTVTEVDQDHKSGPDGLMMKFTCDVRGEVLIAGLAAV